MEPRLGKGIRIGDARTGYVTEFIPDYEIPNGSGIEFLHQTAAETSSPVRSGGSALRSTYGSDHDVGPDNCRINSLLLEQAYLSHERFDMLRHGNIGFQLRAGSTDSASVFRLITPAQIPLS